MYPNDSAETKQWSVRPRRLRDVMFLSLVHRALHNRIDGRLTLTLPSGACRVIGRSGDHAEVHIHHLRGVLRAMRRGTLGFAEAILQGEMSSPDLEAVFRFFIDNRLRLEAAGRGAFRVRGADIAYHAGRANSRTGSRENIAEHYDLGNDFYAAWLDPGMAYSSGLYLAPDATLDDAQEAKYEAVLSALDLRRGHRVLEIGCGWGGFAEAAAARGADLTAITLSARQLAYTRQRISAMTPAPDPAPEIAFRDYRDTEGTFDRIASIEMIEAVGAEHWQTYFDTLKARLAVRGVAVIQAITIREASFAVYSARPDFIQRYVFPGGMLPTKTHLQSHAEAAGLTFETTCTFGPDYARTLRAWQSRFNDQWPQIAAMGFDERFRRLWNYYLSYCSAGFDRGVIDVGIYKFRRPEVA